MTDALVDRIYEASLVPEHWPCLLEDLACLSGSVGGVMFATDTGTVTRWTAAATTRQMVVAYTENPDVPPNDRPRFLRRRNYLGFLREIDFLPPGHLDHDPIQLWLRTWGLGWQCGTMIPMPSGELVIMSFDRPYERGPHAASLMPRLDALRPHLARAAMIAARLGLERARTAVATLEALGLPAAVLDGAGRALAVNGLVAGTPEMLTGAYGRLRLNHPPADALLREALGAGWIGCAVRSVALPSSGTRSASIVHVLPLCREAQDVLGGATLVVLTHLKADANIPDAALLPGLFDLTPREADIVVGLAAGHSLHDSAAAAGLTVATARSYLESIFRKTGTHRQGQLVALVKGRSGIQGEARPDPA
ncbi:MAG: helix-turn-helix transcriptional regulator [Methylorubrum rhodinum]|uniref:helix-turn-helix transcriptional regulator n=1 Tax=Methylorubrum rhodinum TaxID=29428 RepID=UPI003BB1274D